MKLQFDYSPLWKLLERRQMNKGDLKNILGCSSSTIAKLTAGQCVSMEVLGNIVCQLGCRLDDIVQISATNTYSPWQSISKEITFRIHLCFLADGGTPVYVFGYATPYAMTSGDMDKWNINTVPNHPGALAVEGYADGNLLRDMIASAELGERLGQFADRAKISLKPPSGKEDLESVIRNAAICNGRCIYRPPYLLPSWQACRKMRQASLPELSPTDGLMVCESLAGQGKQILYETKGMPDTEKMQGLLSLLESVLSVSRSISDVKRLGNFEVLFYPSGGYDGKSGVNIRVEKGSAEDRAPQVIRMTFHDGNLRGDYLVELITFADTNLVSDEVHTISCDGTSLELVYPTRQIISRIEVKIWENSAENGGYGKLIAHWAHDLILGYAINLDVVEFQFSMNDRWEKMLSNAKKEMPSQRISHIDPIHSRFAANAWEADDDAIEQAFQPLLTDPLNPDADRLFPAGEKHQVEYLEWMRQILDQPDIHRIVLIDPYVKLDTLSVILRCLKDVAPAWEVYTDNGNNSASKRIAEMKEKKAELDLVAPPKFSIRAVNRKLHDRFLFLMSQDKVAVYMLSNSFDTAAEDYSSVAVRIGDRLAWSIYDHYLNLFAREKEASGLEEVYISPQRLQEEKRDKNPKEITVTLPTGIDSMMKVDTVSDAIDILTRFLQEGEVTLAPYFQRQCLFFSEFFTLHKVVDYGLLMDAGYLSEQIVNYHHFTWRSPALGYAAKTLLKLNPPAFLDVLGRIAETPLNGDGPDFRPGYLAALMMYTLLESSGGPFRDAGMRKTLLSSKLAPARAVAVVQCVYAAQVHPNWQNITVQAAADELRGQLTQKEFLCAAVFFLRELRVTPKAFDSPLMADNPAAMRHCVIQAIQAQKPENCGEDAIQEALVPLYPQFSHDIGGILYEAKEAGIIKKDTVANLFRFFILKRYQDSYQSGQDDIRLDDLERSCEMLNLVYQIDPGVVKQLQKGMKKLEINLDSQLYRPFLKQQDYSAWKHTIDLFGALVYLELYIEQKCGGHCNSTAVAEYWKICENFETDLRKYSPIYGVVKRLATRDSFL